MRRAQSQYIMVTVTFDKLLKITQSDKIKNKCNFLISKIEFLNSQHFFDCGLYHHAGSTIIDDIFFQFNFMNFNFQFFLGRFFE